MGWSVDFSVQVSLVFAFLSLSLSPPLTLAAVLCPSHSALNTLKPGPRTGWDKPI